MAYCYWRSTGMSIDVEWSLGYLQLYLTGLINTSGQYIIYCPTK